MPTKKYQQIGDVALRNSVQYLESIGLQVYGAVVDFRDGEIISPGCRDYSPAEVVEYRKMYDAFGLWRNVDEDD